MLIPIAVTYVCVLVATVVIIRTLLLNDTARAVNKIKQVEAEVRKKEEAIRREIEEHEKEFARKKAEAEEDLQRRKEESEKEVGRMRDQALADARKEADRLIDQAKKNEEKLRKQIVQEMEEKAVDYGIKTFQLVLSEKMNEHLNRTFIDELLDALSEVDASSITVDASEAQFTSSHPLPAEQKERLERLLQEKFNVSLKINEKIQKDLIAGLAFKLGSLEIDGSLTNRLQEAAAELKKDIIA
jgi:F0F1-type ATP synthase delta subunit